MLFYSCLLLLDRCRNLTISGGFYSLHFVRPLRAIALQRRRQIGGRDDAADVRHMAQSMVKLTVDLVAGTQQIRIPGTGDHLTAHDVLLPGNIAQFALRRQPATGEKAEVGVIIADGIQRSVADKRQAGVHHIAASADDPYAGFRQRCHSTNAGGNDREARFFRKKRNHPVGAGRRIQKNHRIISNQLRCLPCDLPFLIGVLQLPNYKGNFNTRNTRFIQNRAAVDTLDQLLLLNFYL